MEQEGRQFEAAPKFSSPEEELKYLREQVASKEKELSYNDVPAKKEAAISAAITEYGKQSPEAHLEEHLLIENPQFEAVVEHLNSIPHREKMRELYHVLAEKGILNAIKVTQMLGNPHIEGDFHKVLVDYVKTGAIVPGLEKEPELSKELHMSLFEVTLPFAGTQEGDKAAIFKEVIIAMERFYLGMLPGEGVMGHNYGLFSLELVLSNFSNDIVFYIGVRAHMKELFMKQILGSFPAARIEEDPAGYNIFNEFGIASASHAVSNNNFVYPINLADDTEQDPLTVILNSFTKIERNGEGAAIQFIICPDNDHVVNKLKHAVGQIKQGVPVSRATNIPLSVGGVLAKTFSEFVHTQIKTQEKDKAPDGKALEFNEQAIAMIEEKIASTLLRANVRIVVSAASRERAESIRTALESSFNQFNRTQGNGLRFVATEKGRLSTMLHNFTYRERDDEEIILNTKELATMYHLPVGVSQKDAPQLKSIKTSSAPAPADLPSEGTLMGINKYRGETHEIRMTKADRLRHLYVIGQTGTGKTSLLKNMIVEDMKAGSGVCFIDPHGSDVQDILAAVPKERIEDVIYFDPSYMPRPYGLNMLEYDVTHPEQKIFVVNEMLSIFRKLYSSNPESMGPAFEQYFRNATMLVMEDPETGNTMLEIPRVMADVNFRNLKLSRCKNPLVVQFWRDIATKTSGESGLQNMIPYITNKFDVFLQNDIVRPIIAQEKSAFNFREIMDNKKILLVNLSKGKLGEMNANLIGLVLVGKILMAALSRVDSYGKTLPDFYLYIDEFQNISTDSISSILSEARKYGLSLNVAHQFIAQLDEDIKKSVFGNVGSMAVFRVGAEDAEFLESQFAPTFKAADIMKIENFNAYVKMLINGKPVPPFNLATLPPPKGTLEIVEQIKQLSYLKFGKDRKVVDDAIMKKYLSASSAASAQPARPTIPAQVIMPPSGAAPTAGTPAMPSLATASPTPFAQAFARAAGSTSAPVAPAPTAPIILPQGIPTAPPSQVPAAPLVSAVPVAAAPVVAPGSSPIPAPVSAQEVPVASIAPPLPQVAPVISPLAPTTPPPPIPLAPAHDQVPQSPLPQVSSPPVPPTHTSSPDPYREAI